MVVQTEVLIAGAGPTGLVLALWLARLGVRVRIIDRAAAPAEYSQALAVQARTLEFYAQLGLAQTVVERGHEVSAINLWAKGKPRARAVIGVPGAGLSPFPYVVTFPQNEHERLLIERLAALGVRIERSTELVSFESAPDSVVAQLRGPDGATHTCVAAYLAGCDGAHSVVRERLALPFAGGAYTHLFYVADVEGSGAVMNGDVHVGLDRADFLAVFPIAAAWKGHERSGRPLPTVEAGPAAPPQAERPEVALGQPVREPGRVRLVGTVRDEPGVSKDTLGWQDVGRRVMQWMGVKVDRVHWFSTYRVHHRVAEHFRKGRIFLLGDAAHIHSPVGGQGMNTGIGDAVNLSWKLAAVVQGRAPAALLDTYEPERIAFARRLVATTDRAFTALTSSSLPARTVRLEIVPALVPLLFRFARMRRFLFRTVSQTSVHYRGSALSQGRAGKIHGGDRLPWVPSASSGPDNFAPLTSLTWQAHVYGAAGAELQDLCRDRNLPLRQFPWTQEAQSAGLRRNAVYLIRPDGYIALADPRGSAKAVAAYLNAHHLRGSTP